MTESPAYAVTRAYSLSMAHIAKVTDMATRTGKSQGEIVRDAIDLLYTSMQAEENRLVKEAQK